MIAYRKARWFFPAFTVIAAAVLILACDGFDDTDEKPDISIQVLCNGGATNNNFFVNYFIDKKIPLNMQVVSAGTDQAMSFWPPSRIKTVTVSATKLHVDSSLTIIIYKNNEIARIANLSGCVASTFSCSSTLMLDYDIDEEDDETEGVPITGDTESGS